MKKDKIESKGIKSIRSRVANISEFLDQKMTTVEFRSMLLRYIFDTEGEIPEYKLTEKDWKIINQISKEAAVLGGVAIVMMALTLIYFKVLLKKGKIEDQHA